MPINQIKALGWLSEVSIFTRTHVVTTGPVANTEHSALSARFFIDGIAQKFIGIQLGFRYVFDLSDDGGAMLNLFRLSTTPNGTHANGVEYTDGVTIDEDAQTLTLDVDEDTPGPLYYYCTEHSDHGGEISDWRGVSSSQSILSTTIECQSLQVSSYENKLATIYFADQDGMVTSDTPGGFFGGKTLECGTSSLIYSVATALPYDIPGMVLSQLNVDMGRANPTHATEFEISNLTSDYADGNGTHTMTSRFKNGKPTYMNGNGWVIFWNGTDWTLSDTFVNPTLTLKNGDTNQESGEWTDEDGTQSGRGPQSCIDNPLVTLPSTNEESAYYDTARLLTADGVTVRTELTTDSAFDIIAYDFCEPTRIAGFDILNVFMYQNPNGTVRQTERKFELQYSVDGINYNRLGPVLDMSLGPTSLQVGSQYSITARYWRFRGLAGSVNGYVFVDMFKLHLYVPTPTPTPTPTWEKMYYDTYPELLGDIVVSNHEIPQWNGTYTQLRDNDVINGLPNWDYGSIVAQWSVGWQSHKYPIWVQTNPTEGNRYISFGAKNSGARKHWMLSVIYANPNSFDSIFNPTSDWHKENTYVGTHPADAIPAGDIPPEFGGIPWECTSWTKYSDGTTSSLTMSNPFVTPTPTPSPTPTPTPYVPQVLCLSNSNWSPTNPNGINESYNGTYLINSELHNGSPYWKNEDYNRFIFHVKDVDTGILFWVVMNRLEEQIVYSSQSIKGIANNPDIPILSDFFSNATITDGVCPTPTPRPFSSGEYSSMCVTIPDRPDLSGMYHPTGWAGEKPYWLLEGKPVPINIDEALEPTSESLELKYCVYYWGVSWRISGPRQSGALSADWGGGTYPWDVQWGRDGNCHQTDLVNCPSWGSTFIEGDCLPTNNEVCPITLYYAYKNADETIYPYDDTWQGTSIDFDVTPSYWSQSVTLTLATTTADDPSYMDVGNMRIETAVDSARNWANVIPTSKDLDVANKKLDVTFSIPSITDSCEVYSNNNACRFKLTYQYVSRTGIPAGIFSGSSVVDEWVTSTDNQMSWPIQPSSTPQEFTDIVFTESGRSDAEDFLSVRNLTVTIIAGCTTCDQTPVAINAHDLQIVPISTGGAKLVGSFTIPSVVNTGANEYGFTNCVFEDYTS